MFAYCSEHRVGTVYTSLSPLKPPEIEILTKKNLTLKTKNARILFRAPRWYRWHLFSPVQPPEIEISTKNFWTYKRKMLAFYFGHHVDSADTSLSPVLPTETLISKKNVFDWKKMLAYCSDTTFVPLTSPFHQSDQQTSTYRRKHFWTKKRKCSHTVQGTALGPSFHLSVNQKSRYRQNIFRSKNEKPRLLFRATRW